MEEQGIEWVCPNCTKKKAEEAKGKHASPLTSKRKSTEALFQTLDGKSSVASPSRNVNIIDGASVMEKSAAQGSGITQCVVCKKEARNSSIYCSDNCILAHAQETWPKDKPVPVPSPKTPKEVSKGKQEGRVMVFERKTGKVFTGRHFFEIFYRAWTHLLDKSPKAPKIENFYPICLSPVFKSFYLIFQNYKHKFKMLENNMP